MFEEESEIGDIPVRKTFSVVNLNSNFVLEIIEIGLHIDEVLFLVFSHSAKTELIDVIIEDQNREIRVQKRL